MCVRPDHLFLGTHLDNIRDMVSKGRGSRPPRFVGDRHPQARLTAVDVAAIRSRAGARGAQRRLAREFGVSETTVSAIVNGKTWVAS
jgi:hypothetical protein